MINQKHVDSYIIITLRPCMETWYWSEISLITQARHEHWRLDAEGNYMGALSLITIQYIALSSPWSSQFDNTTSRKCSTFETKSQTTFQKCGAFINALYNNLWRKLTCICIVCSVIIGLQTWDQPTLFHILLWMYSFHQIHDFFFTFIPPKKSQNAPVSIRNVSALQHIICLSFVANSTFDHNSRCNL